MIASTGRSTGLLDAAEDHYLHGHLLSSWIVDYIDLEESLAVGSIAQEELAHSAALVRLHGLDEAGRDAFVYERPPEDWTPTRLLAHRLHDWPSTVLRGLLLSHAALLRSERMCAVGDAEVRDLGAVLAAEQQLHILHWERWVRLLGRDPRTGNELRQRAAVVLPLGHDVFGPSARSADLDAGREHHRAWAARVAGVLDAAGVVAPGLGDEPSARSAAHEQPELVEVLSEMRALRLGPDDGVRGLYR